MLNLLPIVLGRELKDLVFYQKCLFGSSDINVLEHRLHRRTGRGSEGGCSPPKFWATQIFWVARENLGKASF